jgi:hypothetical protein
MNVGADFISYSTEPNSVEAAVAARGVNYTANQ